MVRVLWALMCGVVLAGCGKSETRPPPAPEIHEVKRVHYLPTRCPNDQELLNLKDKCFASIDEREAKVEELKEDLLRLREQLRQANERGDEWQKRYNDYQCD